MAEYLGTCYLSTHHSPCSKQDVSESYEHTDLEALWLDSECNMHSSASVSLNRGRRVIRIRDGKPQVLTPRRVLSATVC